MAKMKEFFQVAFIVMAIATAGYNIYTGATVQKIGIPGVFEVVIGLSGPENDPEATRPVPVSPTNTPTPTESSPESPERISFLPGSTSATRTPNLTPGSPKRYVLGVQEGQRMSITISSDATITILDTEGNPLAPISASQGLYKVLIPQTGDYTVVLAGEGKVTVSIDIPPL
jgi:hypothetical protein